MSALNPFTYHPEHATMLKYCRSRHCESKEQTVPVPWDVFMG
jgi:hypothetical protein